MRRIRNGAALTNRRMLKQEREQWKDEDKRQKVRETDGHIYTHAERERERIIIIRIIIRK